MARRQRRVWPVPVKTERAVLAVLLDCIHGKSKEGERPRTARDRIMAAKAFTSLQKLSLQHERSEVSLADLVSEAEGRAEIRKHERDSR
jgi:hypothetical protein